MTSRVKTKYKEVVSLGGNNTEKGLPYPIVHYPGHYGICCTFSYRSNTKQHICSCAVRALNNYFELSKRCFENRETNGSRQYSEDHTWFSDMESTIPSGLYRSIESNPDQPLRSISVMENICHKCCGVAPQWRWCHKMYHTRFQQIYGWYVEQEYLHQGINKWDLDYLESTGEKRFREIIDSLKHLKSITPEQKPFRPKISTSVVLRGVFVDGKFISKKPRRRKSKYTANREKIKQYERELHDDIENSVRAQFGYGEKGSQWINETLLFKLVKQEFKNKRVIQHYTAQWLQRQHIDIYIPALQLAIEYQGQQHYHSVEHFGGEDALHETQERDERKRQSCIREGVRLIEYKYDEPLTIKHLRSRLRNI